MTINRGVQRSNKESKRGNASMVIPGAANPKIVAIAKSHYEAIATDVEQSAARVQAEAEALLPEKRRAPVHKAFEDFERMSELDPTVTAYLPVFLAGKVLDMLSAEASKRHPEDPESKRIAEEIHIVDAFFTRRARRLANAVITARDETAFHAVVLAANHYLNDGDPILWDAREQLASGVRAAPLIKDLTQHLAAAYLTKFVADLYDAFAQVVRYRSEIADIYIAKMADAAGWLGFGNAPLAARYEGKDYKRAREKLPTMQVERVDEEERAKDVRSLVRCALRMRGFTSVEAEDLIKPKGCAVPAAKNRNKKKRFRLSDTP